MPYINKIRGLVWYLQNQLLQVTQISYGLVNFRHGGHLEDSPASGLVLPYIRPCKVVVVLEKTKVDYSIRNLNLFALSMKFERKCPLDSQKQNASLIFHL